jgi:glycosyltransferase involved in cell wall biosynthesis
VETGPVVSVIVPTRNSARTLGACLSSIRDQPYCPIEVIVVDNGSTDATCEIAQQLADRIVESGPERSAQRNRGFAMSRGQFVLFVDSDMRLEPTVVGECLSILAATGERGVVIPEVSFGTGFWARCRALERSCYLGDNLIEAARFFPRDAFEASGGYDESLVGGEDWDLAFRIAAGRRLPRSQSRIHHDEGRLALGKAMAKKRYYASSFAAYYRKHGARAMLQFGVIRPAFIRNWYRLLRHPVLTAGIFVLKTLEFSAAVLGILSGPSAADSSRIPIGGP